MWGGAVEVASQSDLVGNVALRTFEMSGEYSFCFYEVLLKGLKRFITKELKIDFLFDHQLRLGYDNSSSARGPRPRR